jgi:hypothetical protein
MIRGRLGGLMRDLDVPGVPAMVILPFAYDVAVGGFIRKFHPGLKNGRIGRQQVNSAGLLPKSA